ncbi:hypothetical protein [Streptomyces sp. SS8]
MSGPVRADALRAVPAEYDAADRAYGLPEEFRLRPEQPADADATVAHHPEAESFDAGGRT